MNPPLSEQLKNGLDWGLIWLCGIFMIYCLLREVDSTSSISYTQDNEDQEHYRVP